MKCGRKESVLHVSMCYIMHFFLVLGIEPRALHMLNICSNTEGTEKMPTELDDTNDTNLY
jgi:hypothetical protein